jgi:hypothetical protein
MLNGTRYLARQFQGALLQKRRYSETEYHRSHSRSQSSVSERLDQLLLEQGGDGLLKGLGSMRNVFLGVSSAKDAPR